MIVSAEQLRAARALLRLDQRDLATMAHVSPVTVRRLEAENAAPRVAPATLAAVQEALERAGVEFIQGGVRRGQPNDPEQRFQALRDISLTSARRLEGRDLLTDADLYDETGLPT